MTVQEIEAELASNIDTKYRDFNAKLTPTGYPMLGVRIPVLRKLAAEIVKADFGQTYLQEGRRDTFEHILLYGFVTAGIKCEPSAYLERFDAFVPYIDNWAVCDCVVSSLKPVKKFLPQAVEHFMGYASGNEWAGRVLAVFMLDYMLCDDYIDKVLDTYATMPQGTYYVDMAIAWGLSVALVKYYDKTKAAVASGRYSAFVTDKAIQKARESYRITPAQKAELSALKTA